jgi:hypothetical protein
MPGLQMETKLQMDVKAYEAEDEVDVDVVVGCDMPMSIYLQPIIVITFVSKLLRSKLG